MANDKCTNGKMNTSQYPMDISVCTSDDTMNVNLSVEVYDPNQGYTTSITATLQRANKYEAWAEDVMTKNGSIYASGQKHITFENIGKKGLPVRVKVVTNFGTFYSATWIR
ncbi:hypothetical protein [Sporosarcina sp. FSL K6-1508]|uniref:hypothetical protein n=1 Tax=Sporosarcina sp. FSL K6-1508 TaxID=2921553 RepID=UPI0030FA226C